jgi:hypothetical protein
MRLISILCPSHGSLVRSAQTTSGFAHALISTLGHELYPVHPGTANVPYSLFYVSMPFILTRGRRLAVRPNAHVHVAPGVNALFIFASRRPARTQPTSPIPEHLGHTNLPLDYWY